MYPLATYSAMTEAHLVELEKNSADEVDRLARKLLLDCRTYDRT